MVEKRKNGVFEDCRSLLMSAYGAKFGIVGEDLMKFVWSEGEVYDIELEGDEILCECFVITKFSSVGGDGSYR